MHMTGKIGGSGTKLTLNPSLPMSNVFGPILHSDHNPPICICRYFLRKMETGSRYNSGSNRTDERIKGMYPNCWVSFLMQ